MCDELLEYFFKELTMVKYVYLHPQFNKPCTMKAYRSKQCDRKRSEWICVPSLKKTRQLTMWY